MYIQWRRNEFESGGTGPETSENFSLVVPLHFFVSKSRTSRFGNHFRDGQYSFVSFLFAALRLTVPGPRAQQFVKVGGTCPRALNRRHCV